LLGIGIFAISAPAMLEAASVKVNPGESIQEAVDAAAPGTKIIVYPGIYTESHGGEAAVRVTKDNISLMGKVDKKAPGDEGKVILKYDPNHPYMDPVDPNRERDQSGIWAHQVNGFRVSGFTVEGFPGNGIVTWGVTKFKIMKNESRNNLVNGIWPVLSAKGMVKSNVSYGSRDTTLWVEASEDVKVLKNELYHSPTGLEITVSKNVKVLKNDIHDNVTGVGLYHPNAASVGNPYGEDMGNWTIKKNHIYNNNGVPDPNDPNNRINNAKPGSFPELLPIGGGVLLFGVDDVVLKSNLIENNNFYGITVIDYCTPVQGSNQQCKDPDDPNSPGSALLWDPVSDNNLFQGNELRNNAMNPPLHDLALFTAQIIFLQWDGLLVGLPHDPVGNCFKKNEIVLVPDDPNGPPPFSVSPPFDPDRLPTDGC
jgi:nitrous oxidase accessory protein NosD